jgi:sugar lactone lactonase YvrE
MFTIAFACVVALCGVVANAAEILGKKPAYLLFGASSGPNDQAIIKKIWAPGLDEGYVPQGITVAEGAVLLSGYKSTDPKVDTGPCRVFRIEPQGGNCTAKFDLPEDCGHAGGLAYLGKDSLVVADTRRLYRIDMEKAFQDGNAQNAVQSTVKLGGDLKGSFVDFDGTDLWVGAYDKQESKSKIYRLALSIFDDFNFKGTLTEKKALSSLTIPVEAQGAAFDPLGNLWVTASSSKFGLLYRLNPKTGEKLASYEMVIGIEDIGFDADGKLWSVSEAGSKRWLKWSKTFPIVFQVDLSKLK